MQTLENYKQEQLTIDLAWANIFGVIIIIPIVILFGVPYYFIWHPQVDVKQFMDNVGPLRAGLGMLWVFGILIIGIVLHELIHGITWARFAKEGFKSIKFGVIWKMVTPYCHCKEPLQVKQYMIGALMPAILLGILPAIAALFMGNIGLLVFGMFFTMAAAGDFLIVNLIRKEKSTDLVRDHPSEVGCFIYRKLK